VLRVTHTARVLYDDRVPATWSERAYMRVNVNAGSVRLMRKLLYVWRQCGRGTPDWALLALATGLGWPDRKFSVTRTIVKIPRCRSKFGERGESLEARDGPDRGGGATQVAGERR
jgi:hypothetical protein